ncbi:hypothetical protein R3P38DRAFT_3367681 [Favolaschia claudopus]|uniref:Uncharacterized protein n=1 Tax=Favolaschia claudopus TaxID=2862362 RepID=A0AAW0A7H5_9AGAR
MPGGDEVKQKPMFRDQMLAKIGVDRLEAEWGRLGYYNFEPSAKVNRHKIGWCEHVGYEHVNTGYIAKSNVAECRPQRHESQDSWYEANSAAGEVTSTSMRLLRKKIPENENEPSRPRYYSRSECKGVKETTEGLPLEREAEEAMFKAIPKILNARDNARNARYLGDNGKFAKERLDAEDAAGRHSPEHRLPQREDISSEAWGNG